MDDVHFYEITNVYPKGECKEHLGIVLSGKLRNVKWMHNTVTDFYTLKGLVISVMNMLGIEPTRYSLARVEELTGNYGLKMSPQCSADAGCKCAETENGNFT